MQRERWHGTLELLVAAPAHFVARPAPGDDRDGDDRHLLAWSRRSLWGRLVFGIDLHVVHPLAVRARDPGDGPLDRRCSASCSPSRSSATGRPGRSGTCSSTRSGSICGFLVPLSLFPGWVRPISWVLAPTWGMNAIRESALGGTPLAGHRHVRSRSARPTSRSASLVVEPCSERRARARRPSR